MQSPIEEYFYTVQPFELDFQGKLALPVFINNLLNAAGHHADKRNFGIRHLNENGNTWVLSRLALEIFQYPQEDDTVKIQTWIENIMRTFTLRNFEITKEDGTVIGYAKTVWAMINTETRKPVSLTQQGLEQYICNKECPIQKAVKINTPENFTEESFTVKYSDLDINQHLNSAKYVEHILNAFSLSDFANRHIKRFEIEYIEECFFNNKIKVQKAIPTDTEYVILLRNEQDTIVCKCRIVLSD